MALDFHALSDSERSEVLYHLDHISYLGLSEAFEQFEKKTGTIVDEYGTTRLYASSLKLLAELTAAEEPELAKFLIDCHRIGTDLVAEGD
ncbi:MAG: hypothetical protein AAF250_15380 [Pseudomonadota bacterium]